MMAKQYGLTLQSKAAIGCMKTLMMIFNVIFWVSGVAILAVGIWMKVQLYKYVELTNLYHTEGAYVLMGVGGAIVLFGSLGCLCTVKGKSVLLYMFAGFLMVVFVAELSVGISGFLYRNKLEGGFQQGLLDAMDGYKTDKEKHEALDDIQHALSCCGRDSYMDWFSRDWDVNNPGLSDSVPSSCCVHEGCDSRNLPNDNATVPVWTDGCYSIVTSFMETNFGIIGGVAIGFAFLQLLGALLSCGLAKHINKATYEQVE